VSAFRRTIPAADRGRLVSDSDQRLEQSRPLAVRASAWLGEPVGCKREPAVLAACWNDLDMVTSRGRGPERVLQVVFDLSAPQAHLTGDPRCRSRFVREQLENLSPERHRLFAKVARIVKNSPRRSRRIEGHQEKQFFVIFDSSCPSWLPGPLEWGVGNSYCRPAGGGPAGGAPPGAAGAAGAGSIRSTAPGPSSVST